MNTFRKHMTFITITIGGWLVFLLAGLPSYYTAWLQETRILLLVVWVGAIAPLLVAVTLSYVGGDCFRNSAIFAAYGSAGVLLLDVLYLGIGRGTWISFPEFPAHWVQITGYLAVAVEFPLIGLMMNDWRKKGYPFPGGPIPGSATTAVSTTCTREES